MTASDAVGDRGRRLWSARGEWAPSWLAAGTALLGVVSVLTGALPASPVARLSGSAELLPAYPPHSARAASVALGVLLLLVSGGLRRRKRRAWFLAVVAASAATLLHTVRDLDVPQAGFSAVLLLVLLATRSGFTGVPDPRSRWGTAAVVAASGAVCAGAGVAVVALNRDGQVGRPGLWAVAQEVTLGMVGASGPVQFTTAGRAAHVATTLAALGGVVLLSAVSSLLRPAGGPHPVNGAEQARLRELIADHGDIDSLSYFALRPDKSVIFSPTGKAAIGYRVIRGVTLAAGDPLGDPEAWPGAIGAWLTQARRYAWTPAVLAASSRGATAYQRAGLDALEVGDEAIIDVGGFTLEGRPMRTVRQSVNRVRRLGYTSDVTDTDELTPAERSELRDAVDRWRDGTQERGFSMALGRFADPSDPGCAVVRVRDPHGRLCGMLHLVPWGPRGLSLDLMRRCPQADNGVVELMVVDLVHALRASGGERISLNFAVFRSIFDRAARLGAGPVLRAAHTLLLWASRFWQIESLYRANAKYQPSWEPRFLCFQRASDIGVITLRALQAEAFITLPRPRWRRRREPPTDATTDLDTELDPASSVTIG